MTVLALLLLASAATAQGLAQWRAVASKDAGFSVSMPGQPKVVRGKTKSGKPIIKHSLATGAGEKEMSYVVSYQQLNVTATPQMRTTLETRIRDALVSKPNYTLVSQKPISLQGASGRELVLKIQANVEVLMKMRLYFTGTRMYQVVFATAVGQEKPDDEFRFFSSFKIH